jgi:hypothetical protein
MPTPHQRQRWPCRRDNGPEMAESGRKTREITKTALGSRSGLETAPGAVPTRWQSRAGTCGDFFGRRVEIPYPRELGLAPVRTRTEMDAVGEWCRRECAKLYCGVSSRRVLQRGLGRIRWPARSTSRRAARRLAVHGGPERPRSTFVFLAVRRPVAARCQPRPNGQHDGARVVPISGVCHAT